jgi:hypothetical protein
MDEKGEEVIPELVKDFEGSPLLGPNSIVFSATSSKYNKKTLAQKFYELPKNKPISSYRHWINLYF